MDARSRSAWGSWYAGLFMASAIALSGATYVLLARALAAQDHDVLASMLSRYASSTSARV